MFELFLQNKLKADSDTAQSYTRFISVLKQVDDQLPADAPVRKEREWEKAMDYHYFPHIHLIQGPGVVVRCPVRDGSAVSDSEYGEGVVVVVQVAAGVGDVGASGQA